MAPDTLPGHRAGRMGDGFDETTGSRNNYGDASIEALLSHGDFGRASSVFELGCGTGRFAEILLEKHLGPHGRYVGVDINRKLVDLAAQRLSRFGDRAKVTLAQGLPRIDFEDASFDRFVAASFLTLVLEDETGAFLDGARRVLTPGGLLGLTAVTHGFTGASRLVEGVWKFIDAFRPVLVGGCRPVRLEEMVTGPAWKIRYTERFSDFGVPTQVLVAEKQDVPMEEEDE